MTEITDTNKRVEVRLTPDEQTDLDRLCETDKRTRPFEIKWLIAAETARRTEAGAQVPEAA